MTRGGSGVRGSLDRGALSPRGAALYARPRLLTHGAETLRFEEARVAARRMRLASRRSLVAGEAGSLRVKPGSLSLNGEACA